MAKEEEVTPRGAVEAAEFQLHVAKCGLMDMHRDPSRMKVGLYNVICCGRAVTFSLQRLRKVAGFEPWYAEVQLSLSKDPVCKFMSDLRTKIEKQGVALKTNPVVRIKNLDLSKLVPPPGAESFFVMPGTGWNVRNPDGTLTQYFIQLPPEMGSEFEAISDTPRLNGNALPSALQVAEAYLQTLEGIVAESRTRFT